MTDNIAIKDATGLSLAARTTELSAGLHVPHHRIADGLMLVGPAAQSAINTDLLTGTVNGWYDASSFFSASIQIVASAGISAGTITFEQTNDPSSTTGVSLEADECGLLNVNPIVSGATIAASTRRMWQVSVTAKYIRVRIATAFVGGTVQAFAAFSQQPFTTASLNVQQAVAASLAVTSTPAQATEYLLPNSLATTNAVSVKTSAANLFAIAATNMSASVRYLKLYKKATAPTVGTDIPFAVIPLPANSFQAFTFGELGLRMAVGLAFAITGAAADSDTTAIAAGDVKLAISYS